MQWYYRERRGEIIVEASCLAMSSMPWVHRPPPWCLRHHPSVCQCQHLAVRWSQHQCRCPGSLSRPPLPSSALFLPNPWSGHTGRPCAQYWKHNTDISGQQPRAGVQTCTTAEVSWCLLISMQHLLFNSLYYLCCLLMLSVCKAMLVTLLMSSILCAMLVTLSWWHLCCMPHMLLTLSWCHLSSVLHPMVSARLPLPASVLPVMYSLLHLLCFQSS